MSEFENLPSAEERTDKRTGTHACDLIDRQQAIDALCHVDEYNGRSVEAIRNLPSAQPEYTEHEESILTMLFGIAKLIIDLQGGYMEMTDGRYFDNNDLFGLAEKLGINY